MIGGPIPAGGEFAEERAALAALIEAFAWLEAHHGERLSDVDHVAAVARLLQLKARLNQIRHDRGGRPVHVPRPKGPRERAVLAHIRREAGL